MMSAKYLSDYIGQVPSMVLMVIFMLVAVTVIFKMQTKKWPWTWLKNRMK